MSRSPESKTDKQRHLFRENGILFGIESDNRRLTVKLEGPQGVFPLTAWFEQQTNYLTKLGINDSFYGDQADGDVNIKLEGKSPAEFILVLLHEMGHGFAERSPGYIHRVESHRLLPDDSEEEFKAKVEFIAKHEQEAWEIALRLLISIYQKTGWDIRPLIGSPEELLHMMEKRYFSYRNNLLKSLKRRKNKQHLESFVRESFDTHYLRFIVDKFWKELL